LGTDGYFGLMGMSATNKVDNPLVKADVKNKYAFSGSFSLEFLNLHSRSQSTYGRTAPGFGIKTKAEWMFTFADNSADGGGENLGLNFLNVPLLLEACLGYSKGVSRASRTPDKDTYNSHIDGFGNITTEHRYQPGVYSPGGNPISTASFIYAGPQICYIVKSFHNNSPITDANLNNNTLAFVGGFNFWFPGINLDVSYQKGLTSIYNNKTVMMDGFMLRLGFWLASYKRRLY
jgi:hypothetical protein